MRPIRLELSGFATFRDPTTVEFDDVTYFALIGPTGSGKSTIIDAICFALYGSVPRYDNENLVAPVISQGALEARVRLDFLVGRTAYSAVRVVRRMGKGATTKEARLERAGEVLAGTADELCNEVQRLLGLSFKQFTKCVVLPQGDFARFLHDKPSHRQDLLVRLLNLDVYERMRQAANQRAAGAKSKVALLEDRLAHELGFATEEALHAARERLSRLESLREQVSVAAPTLEKLASQANQAISQIAEVERWLGVLGGLSMPVEVAELTSAARAAAMRVKEAEESVVRARSFVDAATKDRAKLPDRVALLKASERHERRSALEQALVEDQGGVLRAETAHSRAVEARNLAEQERDGAVAQLKTVEDAHRAHVLAKGLKEGEPCPVCSQTVATLPELTAPTTLTQAEQALQRAEAALATTLEAVGATGTALTRAAQKVEAGQEEIARLTAALIEYPDAPALTILLDSVTAADKRLEEAREAEREAHDALRAARKVADDATERGSRARREFGLARDALVPLGAPAAAGEDLAEDWTALLEWADKQRPQLEKQKAEAESARESASRARAELTQELEASCRDCEIELDGREFLDVVSAARADASADVARITRAMEDAARLRTELGIQNRAFDLSHSLSNHLSARGFEKWLVNEAVRRLVVGASQILRELSGGQYALTVDDAGNFLVTDHHNADEVRLARTLSGGETFLASLSLALALADQLTELATEGAARLDAIFLDEGFGTLDPETLETVAATVENLSAGGRMVGIVTHVRELAERVPVQFRVKKVSGGSSVEKVTI